MGTCLSLYELNEMISRVIEGNFPTSLWVQAELMEIRESRGHCYMELVQNDIFSAIPVAKASAKCWRSSWMKVSRKFFNQTGENLQKGMKLLLNVNVEFHPTYGFSLIISDIDPAYTLGEMAQKRQEIINKLKEEGVYDLQHELTLPTFCQRIAVISSQTAAGYGDFCDQLACNSHGYCFYPILFPAVMQGEAVSQSIISCLDTINNRIADFDCVVIIRGGGATSDMSGFDSLELAENVANFPLPIITGIGHERDECVLDLISYHKVKTPTAAAEFLISNLYKAENRIGDAKEAITRRVKENIEKQMIRIERLSSIIQAVSRLYCSKNENRLELLNQRILGSVISRFKEENHHLQLITERLKSLDPSLMLKRGYTMTLAEGKIVKDARLLKSGQEIETVFAKGKIKSVVK